MSKASRVRRVVAEEAPPAAFPELREELEAQFEGEVFCRSVVEDLVLGTEPDVVGAYMDELAVPWAVQSVLTDVVETLALAFLERESVPTAPGTQLDFDAAAEDGSDVSDTEAEAITDLDKVAAASKSLLRSGDGPDIAVVEPAINFSGKLTAGARPRQQEPQEQALVTPLSEAGPEPMPIEEPSLVPADSWCRATIQQRRRIGDRRESVGTTANESERAAATKRLAAPGANKSVADLGASGHIAKPRTRSTASAGAPARVGSAARSSSAVSDAASAQQAASQDGRQSPDTFAEEQRLLASVTENMNRMKTLRAMSEQVHKQLLGLRGGNATPFTVDGSTNQVLEVVTVDPKHLPPQRAEPRIGLADEAEGGPPPADTSGKSRAQKPERKKKREGEGAGAFWQPEPNSNPMVTDVVPAAGVTHRDGESVKTTELKPPKTRVSRHEYTKMIALQNATSTAVHSIGDDATEEASKGPAPAEKPAAEAARPERKETENAKAADSKVAANATARRPSATNTRVATPNIAPRPSSQLSNASRRHPGGGISGHSRTPSSRVSTPGPTATRPVFVKDRTGEGAARVASAKQSRTGVPALRVVDAEDDVARDFLASLTGSNPESL